jgi:hypothetical protein
MVIGGPTLAAYDQPIDPGAVQARVNGMLQFDLRNHNPRKPDQTAQDTATCRELIAKINRGEPIQ